MILFHNVRNTSGFRGVSFDPKNGKYKARIQVGASGKKHKEVWLGYWPTAELAAKAYDQAARKFHGPTAQLNF